MLHFILNALEISMPLHTQHDHDTLAVADRQAERPAQGQVVLLNDDFTPMDFVVEVLTDYFAMPVDQAEQVMLQVHQQGRGLCGVYPWAEAQEKAQAVMRIAQHEGHPLRCQAEKLAGPSAP